MFATIRRIALALAGAAALVAAGKARADHDRPCPPGVQPDYQPPAYAPPEYQPPAYAPPEYQPPAYPPPEYQPPAYPQEDRGWQASPEQAYRTGGWSPPYREPGASLSFTVALPPPPAWLAVAPPPVPAYGSWTRHELEREYRWLEVARSRFYRFGAVSPWRVRQFEAWYQLRRAGLDRRWAALAWAPGPRHGWRGAAWDGRGEGWGRGHWERERWERDD